MSFLLAKMAFWLLFAALFGGLIAWWLTQRHFVGLSTEQRRQQGEWNEWRQHIEQRLAQPAQPDWAPVMQRLGQLDQAINGIHLPVPEPTNLRPVLDAVATLRMPEVAPVNLEPLNMRLQALEHAVKQIVIPASAAAPNLQPLMASLLELQRAVAVLGGTSTPPLRG
jgi:hypothetical protein